MSLRQKRRAKPFPSVKYAAESPPLSPVKNITTGRAGGYVSAKKGPEQPPARTTPAAYGCGRLHIYVEIWRATGRRRVIREILRSISAPLRNTFDDLRSIFCPALRSAGSTFHGFRPPFSLGSVSLIVPLLYHEQICNGERNMTNVKINQEPGPPRRHPVFAQYSRQIRSSMVSRRTSSRSSPRLKPTIGGLGTEL